MSAAELQMALTESGISAYPRPGGVFSLETCSLMISLLDAEYNGTLTYPEFQKLCAAIDGWKGTFARFDTNRSGAIEIGELAPAIASYGYRLSETALRAVTARYSKHSNGQITFDDFVALSVRLRTTSDRFRAFDPEGDGYATMHYDQFIALTMSC